MDGLLVHQLNFTIKFLTHGKKTNIHRNRNRRGFKKLPCYLQSDANTHRKRIDHAQGKKNIFLEEKLPASN